MVFILENNNLLLPVKGGRELNVKVKDDKKLLPWGEGLERKDTDCIRILFVWRQEWF